MPIIAETDMNLFQIVRPKSKKSRMVVWWWSGGGGSRTLRPDGRWVAFVAGQAMCLSSRRSTDTTRALHCTAENHMPRVGGRHTMVSPCTSNGLARLYVTAFAFESRSSPARSPMHFLANYITKP